MLDSLNAVLVVPPLYDFYFTPHRLSAIGAKIAFDCLRGILPRLEMVNFCSGKLKVKDAPLPADLGYLEGLIMPTEYGPTSYFTGFKRLGNQLEVAARVVLEKDPQIVLISCFAFAYADETIELARLLKRQNPDLLIGCAGAGVSPYPEFFMEKNLFDLVINGEAEVVTRLVGEELEARLSSGKLHSGKTTYIEGKNYCSSPNGFFSYVKTIFKDGREIRVYSASLIRGCLKRCKFCSNFLSQGRTMRLARAEDVEAEIVRLKAEAGEAAVMINFEDDNLMMEREYFFSIIKRLKAEFADIGFTAENGIDYMLLDEAAVEFLLEAGFLQFNLSLGTLSRAQLESQQRQGSLARFEAVVASILAKKQVPIYVYFICGLEGDTMENIVDTIVYLRGMPVVVGISLFYAVPNLPGFEEMRRFAGKSSHICSGAAAYPWNGSLDSLQMITAFRLARLVNLMKAAGRSALEEELLETILTQRKLFTLEKGSNAVIPVEKFCAKMCDYFFKRMG
ncbi:MAG: radical SAM protein [Spirochaetales bacterium]|nr:radical SAM protein [Spirochaetales bacterium]